MLKKVNKFIKLFSNRIYRSAVFKGSAAGIEHEKVLKSLSCRTIIDIGANKGQFAIAARNCFPDAMIYSFEPLSHPAKIFEKVFKEDKKVRLFRFAVSNESGEAKIHISHREDSSSLLPIGDRQNQLFPGTYETGIESIRMKRLGEVLSGTELKSPVLMKIDVQGFELNVIKGSEELLEYISYIYAECSYIELYKGQALVTEVSDFLNKKDFKKTGEYNTSFDSAGKPIQSDFLFERKL